MFSKHTMNTIARTQNTGLKGRALGAFLAIRRRPFLIINLKMLKRLLTDLTLIKLAPVLTTGEAGLAKPTRCEGKSGNHSLTGNFGQKVTRFGFKVL